jgi:hypothetical protein
VHRRFDPVLQLLHREYDVHVDDVIEVMGDALELAGHVIPDGRRDLQMVAGEM